MKTLLLLLGVVVLVSCNKLDENSDADDTTNADLVATMGQLSAIVGAGGTGVGRAAAGALDASRATCASIPFGGCVTDHKERNLSSPTEGYCTRGAANLIRTFGKSLLSYVDIMGCDYQNTLPANTNTPTVTHTFDNYYMQRGANGRRVLIYSGVGTVAEKTFSDDDLNDFEGIAHSGGSIIRKYTPDVKVTVSGIHHRGVGINGRYTFWHTLYSTTDALTVTNGAAGSDQVLNGTMTLAHNRLKRKITKVLTNVNFTSTCRYPTSGTTSYTWTGGSFSVTWGACGTAKIDGVSTTLDTES